MWKALCLVVLLLGGAECQLQEVSISMGQEMALQTPGFPLPAPANLHKTWVITSPPGSRITLGCYDIRLVQNNPPDCEEDFLIVDSGAEALEICGNRNDLLVQSKENVLKVEIKKGLFEGGGFQCMVAVPLTRTSSSATVMDQNVNLAAGGPPVTFTTLNYPDIPPTNLTQIWRISTKSPSRINITCSDLRTLSDVNGKCVESIIIMKVVDGRYETFLCGQHSGFTMLSSGQHLTVFFKNVAYSGGLIKCQVKG